MLHNTLIFFLRILFFFKGGFFFDAFVLLWAIYLSGNPQNPKTVVRLRNEIDFFSIELRTRQLEQDSLSDIMIWRILYAW